MGADLAMKQSLTTKADHQNTTGKKQTGAMES